MFALPGCLDDSYAVFSTENQGETAYYTLSDLENQFNYINDWPSSIMIPLGYSVTLFDNDGFGGDHETYQGQEYSNGRMVC